MTAELQRARLLTLAQPTARLEIRPAVHGDSGTYRCRVDYKANQTQNYFVQLTVIGKH